MALGFLHHPLEPEGPRAALSPALGLTLNGVSIPLVAAEANAGALVGALGSFPATVLGASEWTLEAASSNAIRVTLRSTRVTYRA
jgi:hypothetical protein